MKKYLLTIICLMVLLGITGCKMNKNDFVIGKESQIKIANKNVSLSVKENTLTNTGVTLILKNNSDVKIQYGNPYEIEIKKDGKWHQINVELLFDLPAFVLNANESKELELNWENSYGKLAPGEYRVIKSIDILRENDTFESFNIAAQFVIE